MSSRCHHDQATFVFQVKTYAAYRLDNYRESYPYGRLAPPVEVSSPPPPSPALGRAASLQVTTDCKRFLSGDELPPAVDCKKQQHLPARSPLPVEGVEGTAWQLPPRRTKGGAAREEPPAFRGPRGSGISSEPARAARPGGQAQVRRGGEEGPAARLGGTPDSCRGGGGLLGTETRDAAAAEKSLITHSGGGVFGGDTPPGARTPEPRGPGGFRGPLRPPRARARAGRVWKKERTRLTGARSAPRPTPHGPTRILSPEAEIPHPPTAGASVNLRQFPPGHPALGEARRPAAAASFYRQTRLYVCGAEAHAQTPSSLLLSRPPPAAAAAATASASSGPRSPLLLLLRSGAGPSSPDAARDRGIRRSRRRALVTTTTAPSSPAALPRHPPTHPPRSPTPTKPHLSFL